MKKKKEQEKKVSEKQTTEESVETQQAATVEDVPQAAENVELTAAEYDALRADADQLKTLKDDLLRKAADFENTKRRLVREKEEFVQYANKKILQEFLTIMDNLERALQSAQANHSLDSLIEGVTLVDKQMRDVMAGHGLKKIEAVGEAFDPHKHEAIGTVESDEYDDDVVAEEIAPGYMYKESLLRPSMVRVNRKPEQPQEEGAQ